MQSKRIFLTIDTHTVGQGTRHVVGGIPVIPGNTMSEKMLHMKEKKDWIRTLISGEPRGSKISACTILTAPCTPGTDIGVLYFEPLGWLPMCGHDTIGVGTLLVETGMVEVQEPTTEIRLDTPAGVIQLKVHVEGGKAKSVSFVNAPAFVIAHKAVVHTKEYGDITLNVSYGGNFYGIIPVSYVNLEIAPESYDALIAAANIIKPYINEQLSIAHPEKPFINQVSHIQFVGPPKTPGAYSQNCVVCTPGGIDRSPCGTGTSARCALLYRDGEIGLHQPFVHESIIGSVFSCQAIAETTVGGIPAIIPEVTGAGYLMGMSTYFLDPEDPFQQGFII